MDREFNDVYFSVGPVLDKLLDAQKVDKEEQDVIESIFLIFMYRYIQFKTVFPEVTDRDTKRAIAKLRKTKFFMEQDIDYIEQQTLATKQKIKCIYPGCTNTFMLDFSKKIPMTKKLCEIHSDSKYYQHMRRIQRGLKNPEEAIEERKTLILLDCVINLFTLESSRNPFFSSIPRPLSGICIDFDFCPGQITALDSLLLHAGMTAPINRKANHCEKSLSISCSPSARVAWLIKIVSLVVIQYEFLLEPWSHAHASGGPGSIPKLCSS